MKDTDHLFFFGAIKNSVCVAQGFFVAAADSSQEVLVQMMKDTAEPGRSVVDFDEVCPIEPTQRAFDKAKKLATTKRRMKVEVPGVGMGKKGVIREGELVDVMGAFPI